MAKRTGQVKPRRKPTYGAATRLARIVHGLHERPYGWSVEGVRQELGISERTLLRYLAACRQELLDRYGRPILESVRRGDRRVLQLYNPTSAPDSTAYEVLFLHFALSVFQFLEGTVIKDGVEGLWDRLWKTLPRAQQLRLGDFARKFYAVPYAVKDYREADEILDTCVQALVYQHRLRVAYRGLRGEGHEHVFDPYTLTMYRGGLYLIGYSHRYRKIIWLAIERIGEVETLDTTFEYPKAYSPQKHTEGMFGIIDGPEAEVELQLLNKDTVAYLSSRHLHPTQRFRARTDGTTVLSMRVRGTKELVPWILGLGPYVRVLKPRELRDEVRAALTTAAGLYAGAR